MRKNLKNIFRLAWKTVGIICIALVGVFIICGLPLNEIKENYVKECSRKGDYKMSKIIETNEKIAEVVVEGYKKIESGVVEGYKKIEGAVVDGFGKMSDGFVEKHLMKEEESLEEAKARLAKEQEEREAQAKARVHAEINIPDSSEIVKKNLEAAKNAGKR